VAVAAGLVLLAVGFANVYNNRVTRERDRARAEAARATATAAFVTGLFQSADPEETPGDTLDVLELLDRGARRLTRTAVEDPEVLAQLQTTLGRLYLELGDYPKATPLLDSAVVLQRAIHGPGHEAVVRALRDAAEARTLAGDYPASDSLYRQALAIQLPRLGPSHPEVAVTLNDVADMLARSGQPDSAAPLFIRALTILQAAPDDRRGDIATGKFGLAVVLRHQKNYDQAETLLREVLALRRELSGGERTEIATLNELGSLYLETGRYDRAATALQESLAIRRTLFGSRSRVVARGLDDLALMAYETGRDHAGADSLWHEALAVWEGMYGRNHRDVGMVLGRLGQLELDRGNADSALTLFVAAREAMRNASGKVSADAARMTRFVGIALQRTGHFARAQAELERAVEIQTAVHGPSHLDVATAELSLADILRDRLDFEAADARYAYSLAMLRELGAGEDAIGVGLEGYGRLRLLEGREAAADSLLREALAIARKHYKEGDPRLAQARTDFGLALVRQRRPAEAESLLVGSFPQLSPYEQPRGRYILAELYDRLGRPEVAETYRDRVTSAGARTPDRAH
jgi:serine/threonine-protein kinase